MAATFRFHLGQIVQNRLESSYGIVQYVEKTALYICDPQGYLNEKVNLRVDARPTRTFALFFAFVAEFFP